MTSTQSEKSPNRMAARLFGIFFIIAFLSYGIGTALIDSLTNADDFLTAINANVPTLVTGVLLIALVHSFVNIAMPVIMLPILKPFNPTLAYGYLSAALVATIIMAVGAVFLLLLGPLSADYVSANSTSAAGHELIGTLLKNIGTYTYLLGMAIWAVGGMMFTAVLYKSRLVPRLISLWGFAGYIVLLVGSALEIFGHNDIVEIISIAPGGLFEITLSFWLIFKGFNPARNPSN